MTAPSEISATTHHRKPRICVTVPPCAFPRVPAGALTAVAEAAQ